MVETLRTLALKVVPKKDKPENYFYITKMPALALAKMKIIPVRQAVTRSGIQRLTDEKRIREIGTILKDLGLTWHTGLRCDYINDETAKMLEELGCTSLLLGIETGSDRVLKDIIGKDYANGVKDIKRCMKALAKTKISAIAGFRFKEF